MKKIKYKSLTIRIPEAEWILIRDFAFAHEISMRKVISISINKYLK